MFQIAVCDDIPEIVRQVCSVLEGSALGGQIHIDDYGSGAELAQRLRAGARYDLLILDIELDEVDGVSIGHLLRDELRDSAAQLLYISGRQQYAMALFDTRPLNFLLKPLNEAKLLDCVAQAIRLARPGEAQLTVLVNRSPQILAARSVRYIESYHKRVTLHTAQGELVCRDKLESLARQLPDALFVRIHQSFLVNIMYVSRVQYDRLTLDDGTQLSVSQSYRRAVRSRMMKAAPWQDGPEGDGFGPLADGVGR